MVSASTIPIQTLSTELSSIRWSISSILRLSYFDIQVVFTTCLKSSINWCFEEVSFLPFLNLLSILKLSTFHCYYLFFSGSKHSLQYFYPEIELHQRKGCICIYIAKYFNFPSVLAWGSLCSLLLNPQNILRLANSVPIIISVFQRLSYFNVKEVFSTLWTFQVSFSA